jgi:hypothetical protein
MTYSVQHTGEGNPVDKNFPDDHPFIDDDLDHEFCDVVEEVARALPDLAFDDLVTPPKKASQATRLVQLAIAAELFHSNDGTAYATFYVGNHRETWPLRSKGFKRWLSHQHHIETGTTPGTQALQDALQVLEGKAIYEGTQHQVYVRVAGCGGNIYIDLGNTEWEVIEISCDGWGVIKEAPVKFRRARGMAALPYPVAGGRVDDLRPFVNIKTDDDWRLLVAWVLAALRPQGPYPILVLVAEQGAGKTNTSKRVKALIDPSCPALRADPRNGRDLMIAATNNWILAFDNLSYIQPWLSDALCRLSTGGGFTTRELWTDGEETIFDAKRPATINGIEDIATRGDLLDRTIPIQLPVIQEGKRRPEQALDREFEVALPLILGAFLSVVSGALRDLPTIKPPRLPRMADFALWIAAAEGSLGWEPGEFAKAYSGSRADAHVLALESSAVGSKVRELIDHMGVRWEGTSSELLDILTGMLPKSANGNHQAPKAWPKNARGMSSQLRRVAPHLRAIGIDVTLGEREPHTGRRLITIEWISQPVETTPPLSTRDRIPSFDELPPYTR